MKFQIQIHQAEEKQSSGSGEKPADAIVKRINAKME